MALAALRADLPPSVPRMLPNGGVIRAGSPAEAPAMHALITANLEGGHLLPRTLDDLTRRAARFLVIEREGWVIGCAELAPLSPAVAEVRSLVVDKTARGGGLGALLIEELSARARREGFSTLCAFTHVPAHFVRLGFSIVPHVWLPQKIARDCTTCAKFRVCGQYAVMLHPGDGPNATIGRGAARVTGRPARARPLRTSVRRFLPSDGPAAAAKMARATIPVRPR